jgi:hypothetical protein
VVAHRDAPGLHTYTGLLLCYLTDKKQGLVQHSSFSSSSFFFCVGARLLHGRSTASDTDVRQKPRREMKDTNTQAGIKFTLIFLRQLWSSFFTVVMYFNYNIIHHISPSLSIYLIFYIF